MRNTASLTALAVLAVVLAAPFHWRAWSYQDRPYSRGDAQTVTLAPDTQYRSGWLHETFFGANYRELWCTPLEAEVLDLDGFAGGLRPTETGGGKQTKSLRFRGADGKEYRFRSIRKNPEQILPPTLRQSLVADLVQDQISSAHPVAGVVVSPLLDAVGVLNAVPRIVVLPNSSKLGEFQEEFGGLLGMLEESAEEPEKARDGETGRPLGGADKFLGTIKLFKQLEEDNDDQVDEAEFIKARLMDIYLGDWDRHIDQWRWAGYRDRPRNGSGESGESGGRRWVPVPRDRDWAFARFEGLFPWIATIAVPQLESFTEEYPEIEDMTWSGRYVDRPLLVGADRALWDSVALFLQTRLTDDVIARAVRMLPPAMYEKDGARLEQLLKVRRGQLPQAARQFYENLAEYPDIRTSDKREVVEVHYLDSGRIAVTISRRDKDSGEKQGDPFFGRVFHEDETHEIRLYLHGGDDLVRLSGARSASTGVIVVSGGGDDEIVDESTGGAAADSGPLSFFSSPSLAVYDEDEKTRIRTAGRVKFDPTPAPKPATELEKYEPPIRDYGFDWAFAPWFGVSPDEDLFIGGGPILYKHGFRVTPAVYRMQLRGGYATGPGRFRLDFIGDFYTPFPGKRLHVLAEYSELDVLNYFGPGNNSILNDSLLKTRYYRSRSRHFLFAPEIVFPVSEYSRISVGAGVKRFDPGPEPGTITAGAGLDRRAWYGHIRFHAVHDTRIVPGAATGGILARISGSLHPALTKGFAPFRKVTGEFRTYFTPAEGPVTLALRTGGEKIWGDYPWFESAFLGGTASGLGVAGGLTTVSGEATNFLRGFERQRFAGDASVSAGAELRLRLASFMILFPGQIGISGSAETGRVFVEEETSDRWHPSAGGGIWIQLINPGNLLSVSVVKSRERTGAYLSMGFAF